MAKSVFFSFHFDADFWRTQQVRNIGSIKQQNIVEPQAWEKVKQSGDQAIRDWIATQMKGKDAVVVLTGTQTANRRWVRHEIAYAWDNYIPLIGIRIHGLKDASGSTSSPGDNPFERVGLKGGGTVAGKVTLHHPTGRTSRDVYASIESNIEKWISGAYKRN